MKKKIIVVIVLIILFIGLGGVYYGLNDFVRYVDCSIAENSDNKIILKQTIGTFDPSEYGLNIYIVVPPKMVEELKNCLAEKDIDISENFNFTFQYNKLTGIKREKEAVYFYISKIVGIEKSDYIRPL